MTGRPDRFVILAAVLGCVALAVPACSRNGAGPAGEPAAAPAVDTDAHAGAPSEDELKSATYQGIHDTPVTLDDGEWEGEPFVPGGVSRPRAPTACTRSPRRSPGPSPSPIWAEWNGG